MKTFTHQVYQKSFLFFGIFFILSCFLSSPGLSANSKGIENAGSPKKKTVISFKSFVLPKPGDTSVNAKADRAVMRAFLKKYPNYEIRPFHMPSIQGGAMDTGTLMGIASGNPPHAIYVNFRQSSSYINHGFLEPLEVVLARILSKNPKVRQVDKKGNWLVDPTESETENAIAKLKARVPGPVWPVIYRSAYVKKKGIPKGDHIWAMPYGTLVKALLYRKDAFIEAGLDPEKPPGTWEELLEYSKKIKALKGRYGVLIPGGKVFSWSAYSFMVSNGVRYIEKNKDGEWQAAFNTKEAAEAIYYLLRLAKEKYKYKGQEYHGCALVPSQIGADTGRKWSKGEIGMRIATLRREMLTSVNPNTVGIAPIPKSPKGISAGLINCTMLGIFRKTTPAQKIAVMRYIWFITGEDAQKIRLRIFVDNGFGQFMNPELLKKFGYDNILKKVPPSWRKTFKSAMSNGVPEPYGKNTQFIYEKVSEPMTWALLNPELLDLSRENAIGKIKDKLDIQADRVNKYMLGKLTEKEKMQRNIVGTVVLAMIILLFFGSVIWVWRAFTKEEKALGKRPGFKRFLPAYLMLLPALTIIILWAYVPLIMGAPLALFDYELVIQSVFVGIENFAEILYDDRFWLSLGRTFYYALLVIGLGFWPPILLAILLDEVPTNSLKYFFRTVFYLPTIISGIIMVFLWRQLYEPSDSGYLNQILMMVNALGPGMAILVKILALLLWGSLIAVIFTAAIRLKELHWIMRSIIAVFAFALVAATIWPLYTAYLGPSDIEIEAHNLVRANVTGWNGIWIYVRDFFGKFNIEPIGWIQDPQLAMFCCILPMVWATAGPGCIIYLAALKTVPEELVEAAAIDGADLLQRISYITLPRIKFLIFINLLGAIVGAFKGGTNFILAMTGGGPNGATRTLGLDIFERSFMDLNFSVGAAMGWILGACVILITAYQMKRMSKAKFQTANR